MIGEYELNNPMNIAVITLRVVFVIWSQLPLGYYFSYKFWSALEGGPGPVIYLWALLLVDVRCIFNCMTVFECKAVNDLLVLSSHWTPLKQT